MVRIRHAALVLVPLVLLCAASPAQQPERQLPADQRAYRAAMATADPALRLKALRTFSVEYQDSKYFDSVQEAALRLLLTSFPTRSTEIRDQVRVNVSNADKGYARWQEQSAEAELLADAGVLLPLAQQLAEDSSRNLTEAVFLRGMARMFGELQAEMPTPEELHGQFVEARGSTLLALSHVYLRQGKALPARTLLQQAATLQPRSAQVHALRGELLLTEHHPDAALDELLQAQALGELSGTQRGTLLTLYRDAHDGSDAGLHAELDVRYAALNPPAFTPQPRRPRAGSPMGGHTVLLELFTGAGCLPCVGADAAAEALLTTYGSDEVVLLEWDEHVPRPDPLANPASVARAEVFSVGNTPQYVLDGKTVALFGAPREGAGAVYDGLARLVDEQGVRASGVSLRLAATWAADGEVHAAATVTTQDAAALKDTTAAETAPWRGDSISVAARARADAEFPPELVLNFALVEDNVRYSGENGVRFHRMVVRATGSEAGWGVPLHPGQSHTVQQMFDPAALKVALQSYLDGFERGNDRFGSVRFLSKAVSLAPSSLRVVAWVQDTRTHRTVQAAFAPITPASGAGGGR